MIYSKLEQFTAPVWAEDFASKLYRADFKYDHTKQVNIGGVWIKSCGKFVTNKVYIVGQIMPSVKVYALLRDLWEVHCQQVNQIDGAASLILIAPLVKNARVGYATTNQFTDKTTTLNELMTTEFPTLCPTVLSQLDNPCTLAQSELREAGKQMLWQYYTDLPTTRSKFYTLPMEAV
jgi:hypothetical protein